MATPSSYEWLSRHLTFGDQPEMEVTLQGDTEEVVVTIHFRPRSKHGETWEVVYPAGYPKQYVHQRAWAAPGELNEVTMRLPNGAFTYPQWPVIVRSCPLR